MTSPKHHKNMTDITFDNIDLLITSKSIDTLKVSKFLKQLGLPDAQADAFSEMFKQTNINAEIIATEKIATYEKKTQANLGELASKNDLLLVKKELEIEIHKIKSDLEIKIEAAKFDLIKWVAGLMLAQVGLVFALIKFFTNF